MLDNETKESDFLREDFFVSDYVPEEVDTTEMSEKMKADMKQIYGFAHMMNQAGREYTQEDIRHQAETYMINLDKVEKVFKRVFENNKDEFNIDNKPPIFKIESFLKKNYNLYRNQVTDFLMNGDQQQDTNTIIVDLEKAGFKFSTERLKAMLRDPNTIPMVNPIAEYFNNIDKWDGVDHIKNLCKYITTDCPEFFESMLKKHLVRSIEGVLDNKYNRYVFVLSGENQNIGKSSLINWLNPFGDEYYIQNLPKNDKDMTISITENFFINIDELAGMSKFDINKMKQLISQAVVKERRPHATNATMMARMATFWATTNNSDFLIDSHNTRWLSFNIEAIDYDSYLKHIDVQDIWRQAMFLYRSEMFESKLTDEEYNRQSNENKKFEAEGIEKQIIKENFALCDKDDIDADFFSTTDVARIITDPQYIGSIKTDTRFINRIMRQIGFHGAVRKINGHPARGFIAKRKRGSYVALKQESNNKQF